MTDDAARTQVPALRIPIPRHDLSNQTHTGPVRVLTRPMCLTTIEESAGYLPVSLAQSPMTGS